MRAPRRYGAAVACLLALALVAGCSHSPSGSPPSHGTTGHTTTTLPPPIIIGQTLPAGPLAFLGPVMRITVPVLQNGTRGTTGTGAGSTSPAAGTGGPAVTVAYRQFGSGPDLLLVMGQSGSMSWWDTSLLQELEPHFRVTMFDLPGIGWSGPDPAFVPSVESYADVTAGLVQTLAIHQPVVLGWGMGGEIAMELALRHAQTASRLVLVDTSAGQGAVQTPAAAASAFDSTMSTPSRLADLLFPSADSGGRASWLLDMQQVGPDDVVASGVSAEARAQAGWWRFGPAASQLAGVTVPTLVVWGTEDAVFPAADGSALVAGLPSAQPVTLAGAGYASLFQENTVFASDLGTFAAA